jgi:hypothetical protein
VISSLIQGGFDPFTIEGQRTKALPGCVEKRIRNSGTLVAPIIPIIAANSLRASRTGAATALKPIIASSGTFDQPWLRTLSVLGRPTVLRSQSR